MNKIEKLITENWLTGFYSNKMDLFAYLSNEYPEYDKEYLMENINKILSNIDQYKEKVTMDGKRCQLCGAFTTNEKYCDDCEKGLKDKKDIKEFLSDNDNLAKLICKNGCINCPINETEYCDMLYEHVTCNNAKDEQNLCVKYLNKWFKSK